jgi:hypothetical protein
LRFPAGYAPDPAAPSSGAKRDLSSLALQPEISTTCVTLLSCLAEEDLPVPTDQIDEPNGSLPKVKTDTANSVSAIRPDTTEMGFDATVLNTAFEAQLTVIHNELKKEIKPKSTIERFYVEDLANILCNTWHLRQHKNSILRYEMHSALRTILDHIVDSSDEPSIKHAVGKKLAAGCYRNKKDRAQVTDMLARFNLNENNIEAEAWRRASAILDLIERQLTSLESRRDKTLVALVNFRDDLALRLKGLKQTVQRITDADEAFDSSAAPGTDKPREYPPLS